MQIWMTLIHALQLLSALVMIGLVLIQHGKGADMGASFGSGASGSLFGASGSANFLSRSTAACATVFFVSTLALAYLGTTGNEHFMRGGSSVLDRPAAGAGGPAAAGSSALGAPAPGAIPSTAPATPATPAPLASMPAAAASAVSGAIPK